jgi:hypothetical protein
MANNATKKDNQFDAFETQDSDEDYLPPPSGLSYKQGRMKMKTRSPQKLKKPDYYRPVSNTNQDSPKASDAAPQDDILFPKTTGLSSADYIEDGNCAKKPNFHNKPSRKPPTILLRDTFIPAKKDLRGNFELKRKYQYDKKMRLDAKYAHDKKKQKQTNNLTLEAVTAAAIKTKVHETTNEGGGNTNLISSSIVHQTDKHLKMKKVQLPISNKEFPFGTLVSICGSNLDPERFEWKSYPPTFYGVVQDPSHYDLNEELEPNEDEELVEFVLAGEYKWLNKSKPNTTQKVVKTQNLTLMDYAPSTRIDRLHHTAEGYKRNFFADPGGWKIRRFKEVCDGCGCHFCYFANKKEELKAMMVKVSTGTTKPNNEKRYECYSRAISIVCPESRAKGVRIRLGKCFYDYVRGAFPDPEYKGFRFSDDRSDDV